MMKRIIVCIMIAALLCLCLTSCNEQIFDFKYEFDYAYIYDTGGNIVKEGAIVSWKDYEGERLQIKFADGSTWLTSSTRCDMVDR